MKLILHIGHEKCGSTSIQEYLSKNSLKLKNSNYYPILSLGNKNQKLFAAAFNENLNDVVFSNVNPDLLINNKHLLLKNIRETLEKSHNFNVICLSSEDLIRFSYNSISNLKIFINNLNLFSSIELVLFLRRQDDLHISWLNNLIKNDKSNYRSFFQYVKDRQSFYDFDKIYDSWNKLIKPKKFHVIPLGNYTKNNSINAVKYFHEKVLEMSFEIEIENLNISKKLSKLQFLFEFEKLFDFSIDYDDLEDNDFNHPFILEEDIIMHFGKFFKSNISLEKKIGTNLFNNDLIPYYKNKNHLNTQLVYLLNKYRNLYDAK